MDNKHEDSITTLFLLLLSAPSRDGQSIEQLQILTGNDRLASTNLVYGEVLVLYHMTNNAFLLMDCCVK